MRASEIATIFLRLIGALWFVSGMMAIPHVFIVLAATGSGSRAITAASAISTILYLAVGGAMFIKSEAIGAWMFPYGEDKLSVSVDALSMQKIGFSLLAVYLGISALGRAAGLLYSQVRYGDYDESAMQYMWRVNKEDLVAATVEMLACVVLFLGAKRLAKFARDRSVD
jgi:hypothetical protein